MYLYRFRDFLTSNLLLLKYMSNYCSATATNILGHGCLSAINLSVTGLPTQLQTCLNKLI